ncbi:MAG: hypothetical protein M0R35_04810 [Candidatus Omnitrophica bacterium]|nr:hypothetical protein [Candidatus Omnitrophota bacterium]
MGNKKDTYFLLAAVGSIILVVSVFSALNNEKKISGQLNSLLNEAIREKEQLQNSVSQLEDKIKNKDARLDQLGDAQALRASLDSARKTIDDLDKNLAKAISDRAAIQENNINLKTRLENTTREFAKAVEELKNVKGESEKSQSGNQGLWKKKSDDYEKVLELRSRELAELRSGLEELKAENDNLLKANNELEKGMRDLDKKGALSKQSSAGQDVSGANASQLKESIKQLKSSLKEKDSRIQQLQQELAQFDNVSFKANSGSQARQKFLESLESANKELKKRISELEKELASSRSEAMRLQSGREVKKMSGLYENAKDQVSRLTDLLLKKEQEIDSAREEALGAREKLFSFQVKLSDLEKSLSASKGNDIRLQDMQKQNLSLQAKMNELQEALDKKLELAESLQKNLAFLTQQLARKEEELVTSQARLRGIDSSSREELEREKARYAEMNLLYASLKTQMAQFSDALNQKDAEVEQRRKEGASLKEAIAELKSRSSALERELADAKERQKKTLDDLIESVKLNAVLQEGKTGALPRKEAGSAGKDKADELRRKIEVILEPQNNEPGAVK